jgi:hypothetical protein
MHREFKHGDEVRARTLKGSDQLQIEAGNEIIGTLCGLHWGVNKAQEDVLKGAQVFVQHMDTIFPVDPVTIEYVTDDNGFYFQSEPEYGSFTVGRNDNLLLDKTWIRTTGAALLLKSLLNETDTRGWVKRQWDNMVTWFCRMRQKFTLRGDSQ